MKREAEKVSSPENKLREMVTILVSLCLVLGLVLVIFEVADLFCEDQFGDAVVGRVDCAACWDKEDEKQMEVKRHHVD